MLRHGPGEGKSGVGGEAKPVAVIVIVIVAVIGPVIVAVTVNVVATVVVIARVESTRESGNRAYG